MNRRVGLVYPFPNLDTVPSLCNAVSLLAEAGYRVDVFTTRSEGFVTPTFPDPRVDLRFLPQSLCPSESLARARAIGDRLPPGLPYRLLRRGYRAGRRIYNHATLRRHARELRRDHQREPFRCLIGVDPHGLQLAHSLARQTPVPIAYFSLELMPSEEVQPAERPLKEREVTLSRRAPFVIIQDERRAALVARDNDLPMDRFVFVPNAPLGPVRRERSRYWHQRFDLDPAERVVLHAGSVDRWTGLDDIVASARRWPEPWRLVVHSRASDPHLPRLEELRALADERVLFSLRSVPRQEYDLLVEGADVSIAFVLPQQGIHSENTRSMGLSSGKFTYGMRAGLPTLVNTWSSLGELVTQERLGEAVDDASGISKALERIAGDYAGTRERCFRFFEERLDFRTTFAGVLSRLDALEPGLHV